MANGYGVNLPLIDERAVPFKTVARIGSTEFCYNYNHKLIIKPVDDSLGYRENELDPEVKQKLDQARQENRLPGKAFINAVIEMQNKRSVKRAVKFVEYRLLGSASYMDVYGELAEEQDERIKHYDDLKELKLEVERMHQENKETQQLLINIGLALNSLPIRVYK